MDRSHVTCDAYMHQKTCHRFLLDGSSSTEHLCLYLGLSDLFLQELICIFVKQSL